MFSIKRLNDRGKSDYSLVDKIISVTFKAKKHFIPQLLKYDDFWLFFSGNSISICCGCGVRQNNFNKEWEISYITYMQFTLRGNCADVVVQRPETFLKIQKIKQ